MLVCVDIKSCLTCAENLMISSEASLLKLFVKMVVKKNEVLGQGTYGCVEVVLCHGVEYAAKRLRTDVRGQDKKKFYQRFRMEYELLSSLEHKNIVAYKGLCFLSHSDLADVPLLMMERLKIDLHRRLVDNSKEYPDPLTLREKISILLDVAEGLEYLHTHIPPVIHRDLTAKNVLLDEKNTAKIGDFGNSRILNVDQSSCFETMTCNLGTLHYSAPEAYPASSSQSYSVKIDIFSFGHMALFVMTGEFLYELLPAVQIQPDGTKESFSEKERRTKYVDMLQKVCNENDIQLMLMLVTDCLDNRPQKRPNAKKLIMHLKSFQC